MIHPLQKAGPFCSALRMPLAQDLVGKRNLAEARGHEAQLPRVASASVTLFVSRTWCPPLISSDPGQSTLGNRSNSDRYTQRDQNRQTEGHMN